MLAPESLGGIQAVLRDPDDLNVRGFREPLQKGKGVLANRTARLEERGEDGAVLKEFLQRKNSPSNVLQFERGGLIGSGKHLIPKTLSFFTLLLLDKVKDVEALYFPVREEAVNGVLLIIE